MAQKLFVGNLAFSATEDAVRDLFAQYGEVTSVNVVTDRMTGRARGFCFVEMENADEAVAALNNQEFEGRPLKVDLARERAPRSFGGNGGSGNGGKFRGGNNNRFGNRDRQRF
ncbi:MAG: RNA-binding protein [Fibrobacter sp.]|nr:RNA-binding protein [Fibrobacter sp.]